RLSRLPKKSSLSECKKTQLLHIILISTSHQRRPQSSSLPHKRQRMD
ncbi:hypothetical protein LINPERHAP1_LOCUS14222, partial [Linum perenne]